MWIQSGNPQIICIFNGFRVVQTNMTDLVQNSRALVDLCALVSFYILDVFLAYSLQTTLDFVNCKKSVAIGSEQQQSNVHEAGWQSLSLQLRTGLFEESSDELLQLLVPSGPPHQPGQHQPSLLSLSQGQEPSIRGPTPLLPSFSLSFIHLFLFHRLVLVCACRI